MAGLVKRFSTGLLLLTCVVLCIPTPLAAALANETTNTTIANAELAGGDIVIQPTAADSQPEESAEHPVETKLVADVGDEEVRAEEKAEAAEGAAKLEAVDIGQDTGLMEVSEYDSASLDVSSQNSEKSDDEGSGPPSYPVRYSGLVITRVQLQGDGTDADNSSQELIEIRNNSQDDIDITDWSVYYTPKNSDNRSTIAKFELADDAAAGMRLIVKPGGYLVFVSNEFEAANQDFVSSGVFNQALANTGGRLMITDQDDVFVSGLVWGSISDWAADTVWLEGEPVQPHAEGNLLARKWLDYSRHQDSKQNHVDFAFDEPIGGLYHVDPVIEMFDACLNIDGISEVVPDGMYRDDTTGDCSATPPVPPNSCLGLTLSEIGANLDSQFIELYNSTDQPLLIDGCQVSTDHSSSKNLVLDELTLEPGSYHLIDLENTELRIYKTTSSKVYILSQDGLNEVDQTEYSDLKPDTSWSLIDGIWRQTFTVTPGEVNRYLAHPPCQTGYIRNIDTGRCNKVATLADTNECDADQYRNPATGRCKLLASASSSLAPCDPGQYRNPSTNRCKSLTASTSSLQPCDPDQYRNPATNRCKQIASTASTLKPCESGYERNPETNRCRKSQSTAAIAGAEFPVETVEAAGTAFIGWWALGGVLLFGLAYAGWEWRHELSRVFRRST